jgi:hypothetical protein
MPTYVRAVSTTAIGLTRVNGKLYTIAKAQSDKSCPLSANALGLHRLCGKLRVLPFS